jgi:glutaredoxin-related protein
MFYLFKQPVQSEENLSSLKEFRILLAAIGDLVQIVLTELTGQPTVPYVFINGDFIGGSDGEWSCRQRITLMHLRSRKHCYLQRA